MAEFKLVLSRKDGKSFQKIIKDKEAGALLKKRIGEKVSGSDIGMEGYELEITGGSDKCGFPMRKGILQIRQKITVKGKSAGFSGKDRNKKKRGGLKRKKTVCGEMIDRGTVQVNLKILKEGKEKLGEEKPVEEAAPAEEGKKEEAPVKEKAPKEEKAVEEKKEEPKPVEEAKEEKPAEIPKEKEEVEK